MDFSKKVYPSISIIVLLGGVLFCGIFFMMYRAVVIANEIAYSNLSIQFESGVATKTPLKK